LLPSGGRVTASPERWMARLPVTRDAAASPQQEGRSKCSPSLAPCGVVPPSQSPWPPSPPR
jgi:hypothetical protein